MRETERKEAGQKPIRELYEKMPLKTRKETKALLAPSWHNCRMQGPHPRREVENKDKPQALEMDRQIPSSPEIPKTARSPQFMCSAYFFANL